MRATHLAEPVRYNPNVLRLIQLTSLLLFFVLAGFYAGRWVWTEPKLDTEAENRSFRDSLRPDLPDFALSDLNGEIRSIRNWSQHTLLINFWATWCAPCLREMPLLQTVYEERRDRGLWVIGIAVDRQPEVEAFIAESGVTYPILIGQQDAMEAAEAFGPEFIGLPLSVFVAPGGQVLSIHSGELQPTELKSMLAIGDRLASGELDAAAARELLRKM
jgi:thiol-disulfide isomerase/thioredoxin